MQKTLESWHDHIWMIGERYAAAMKLQHDFARCDEIVLQRGDPSVYLRGEVYSRGETDTYEIEIPLEILLADNPDAVIAVYVQANEQRLRELEEQEKRRQEENARREIENLHRELARLQKRLDEKTRQAEEPV
jgi:hypothetical protein